MATSARSDSFHVNQITGAIVNSGMKVHSTLGPGLLESAYQACLAHELRSRGLGVATEVALPVVYEGYKLEVGYRIDLVVENRVVVEVKSVDSIHPIHEAQLLSYMRLSGIGVGLLINFNVLCLRNGIKRRSSRFAGGAQRQEIHRRLSAGSVCFHLYGSEGVGRRLRRLRMVAMWTTYQIQGGVDNNIQKFLGASPMENRQLYFDASSISYATFANNKIGVLMVTGTQDDLVDPKQHTEPFTLALKQAGFFVRPCIVQGAPHYWMNDPIEEPTSYSGFLAPRLLRFLAEKL